MPVINQVEDLIKLLNNEKMPLEYLDINRSFKFFCHCLIKSLVEIYFKFKDYQNFDLKDSLESGINLVYHIFWILISYTNNLRLSVFLLERAVLLYIEFIAMPRNPSLNQDIYYLPNINEAVNFAYRKTIGPIQNLTENKPELEPVKEIALDIKNLIYNFLIIIIEETNLEKYAKIEDNDNLKKQVEDNLEMCVSFLYPVLFNFYSENPSQESQKHLFLIINQIILENNHQNLAKNILEIKILIDSLVKETFKIYDQYNSWKISFFEIENIYLKIKNLLELREIKDLKLSNLYKYNLFQPDNI